MNATAMSAVAAAASCTTPRAKAVETPTAPAAPTTAAAPATPTTAAAPATTAADSATPSPSDYVDGPYDFPFVNGTVTMTSGPGALVRVAGDSQIQPDEATRRVLGFSGVNEVTGALEVCSDDKGVPFKVTIIRSTQYVAYDQALDEGARRWRFIPRQIRGKYVSSCFRVQLTYRPWRN